MSQEGAFATLSKNLTHDRAWDLGFILPRGKDVYVNWCMFDSKNFHRSKTHKVGTIYDSFT